MWEMAEYCMDIAHDEAMNWAKCNDLKSLCYPKENKNKWMILKTKDYLQDNK